MKILQIDILKKKNHDGTHTNTHTQITINNFYLNTHSITLRIDFIFYFFKSLNDFVLHTRHTQTLTHTEEMRIFH